MKLRQYVLALAAVPVLALAAPELSPSSQRVKAEFSALTNSPTTAATEEAYLAAFPSDFREFMAIFMPPDFGQLYDGHEYIAPLQSIGESHPEEVMMKLLHLGAAATWDADAPNYLQEVTLTLAMSHTHVFVTTYSGLSEKEKKGLLTFLADGNEGPKPSFGALATRVEKSHHPELATRMLEEAKASQEAADHAHSR
jgi:hypothetical protein